MIGEYVEIVCHDGAAFCGWVDQRTDTYIIISGRGFPLEDIRAMTNG